MIVYYPETEEKKYQLSKRVAQVHADAINRKLQKQQCPVRQKQACLDALIEHVKTLL